MKKISMYMITHKKINYIPKERIPFFVGGNIIDDNYLRDDSKDNISKKNKNYCELTAFYWIWKNDKYSDYISIEHYRRFFSSALLKPISSQKILKILQSYDGVEIKKHQFKVSLIEYYKNKHILSDLKYIEEAIKYYFPEYLETYYDVMYGNTASMCNMIILSKNDFDNYCEWLFKILFYAEERIDISDRDVYQSRVFGFISERLQNIWIKYNKLNMKELPIFFYETSKLKTLLKTIKYRFLK